MSKIGELGKILNGSTIPKGIGQYPAYGGNGIVKYVDKYNYDGIVIIIGRVGANCGSVHICNGKCWVTDNSLAFLVDEQHDPYYVYYLLKLINLNRFHIGSSQPLITQSIISNIEFNYEKDKYKQNKISKILKKIDKEISLNNLIIYNIEKFAEKLFEHWFLQFKVPKKYTNNKEISLVWNENLKLMIPEKWKLLELKDVISQEKNALVDGPFGTQLKISEYVDSGIPVYEMEYLNGRFVVDEIKNFITEEKYESIKRSTVKNGDIIISKTGTLGLLGIVNSKYEKGIIVSRLAKITPNEKFMGKYCLLNFLKLIDKSGYWLMKSSGSTMPILNNELIGKLKILVPDYDLFNKYEEIVSPFYQKMFIIQNKNKQLHNYIDFIAPLMIVKKIEVE